MKILIVNFSDTEGGAARASKRLHDALLDQNIDCKMLVQHKSTNSYTIIGPKSKTQKLIIKLRSYLDDISLKFYKNKDKIHFSTSWLPNNKMIKKINNLNPDIVHLHWINKGMLSIKDLSSIKAPIVWSLHDKWAFTGGCHYDEDCGAYEKKCGSCKVLKSENQNDLSKNIFNRKVRSYSKISNLTIIGLSKWIKTCAEQSTLLKSRSLINLPNPINTKIFKSFESMKARELINLPNNRKLILFGAINATSDSRKGFKKLSEALSNLKGNNIEFVIFGSNELEETQNYPFKTHYLGQLHDDVSLVTLYNAVDVMVVPSLQENLSNVIMESLACGTPVVGFNIGGNSDMIVHKKNGYLAKAFDSNDLSKGIKWILNYENYDQLCKNARNKVLTEFDSKIVTERYIKLYKGILND